MLFHRSKITKAKLDIIMQGAVVNCVTSTKSLLVIIDN